MLSQKKINGSATDKSTLFVVKPHMDNSDLNPEFYSRSGSVMSEAHHAMQPYLDKQVPFIREWYVAFLNSSNFAQLSESSKEKALWMYESAMRMWEDINDIAYETNYGSYERNSINN